MQFFQKFTNNHWNLKWLKILLQRRYSCGYQLCCIFLGSAKCHSNHNVTGNNGNPLNLFRESWHVCWPFAGLIIVLENICFLICVVKCAMPQYKLPTKIKLHLLMINFKLSHDILCLQSASCYCIYFLNDWTVDFLSPAI